MKQILVFTIMIVAAMTLSGCGTTQTIQTEDGQVSINDTGANSWCRAGADWNYQGSDGLTGSWKIIELVSGGKYDGLCHVVFSGMGMESDYYFSEDGETGYLEMTMPNGQKVSQAWSK